MHQPFYIYVLQLHKQAEGRDGTHHAVELVADMVLQVLALEPGLYLAGGVVGPALGHGTVLAVGGHGLHIVGKNTGHGDGAGAAHTLDALTLFLGANHPADTAVHQQVRVAPDGRGEVGIGGIVQAEMAFVLGLVHRLAQGAQQHGLDDVGVLAVCNL